MPSKPRQMQSFYRGDKSKKKETKEERTARFMQYTIGFGKYKGQTYSQILEDDPDYYDWVVSSSKNPFSATFCVLSQFASAEAVQKALRKHSQSMSKIMRDFNKFRQEQEESAQNPNGDE